jgi:SAM-dependent methyltransferase
MQIEWYKNFFYGVALDLWRKAITPEQTRAEVDFLVKTLRPPEGARLLDVPCGGGRHSLELAARGYRTVGVDISEEFIAEARARAARGGLQAEWFMADMRSLPNEFEFGGAFSFGNSFGYLDRDGMNAFARALSDVLKPGARFVLDTGMAAESILPSLEVHRWFRVDDILLLVDNQYDAAHSCLDTEYIFVRGGKTESRPSSHLVYTVAEIERLLGAVGLETQAIYSSLDEQPFRLGSPRLLLVAQKN